MSVQIQAPAKETVNDGAPEFVVQNPDGSVSVDPVKAAEAAKAAKETPAVRPEGLPEGFNTWAELRAAYESLKAPAAAEPAKPATPVAITTPADAAAAAKAAGVDLDALSKEFKEKGELSAESIAALEAKGISKATVTTYIEGQKAQATVFRDALAKDVGGDEGLTSLLAWAGSALTADEIGTYNQMLAGSDLKIAKLAIDGLAAKMERALGSNPTRLNGGTKPASGGVKAFESQAQALKAMSDARYGNDKAYTAKVDAQLEISEVFNVSHG